MDDDLEPYPTNSQKEWRDWAAHGYSKRYTPRSVLRFGAVFSALLGLGLGLFIWLAATGRI